MRERISEAARAFIARHIYSVGQLEILLHVRSQGGPLAAESVARDQRIDVERATDVLADLADRGLLQRTPDGFEYKPQTDGLAGEIDAVAEAYRTHRVTVINLIFAGPPPELRDFADSFRMRKDED